MRKIILLSLLLPVIVSGQVSEDFSDGDFTQDPSWTGDTGHFKMSSSSAVPQEQHPALQLDAPAAGSSHLSVASGLAGDMEWQFWIKQSFNSSSGNYSRIYLMSDQPDLKGPLNGYFLQYGGADDSVRFFWQDSLDAISLLCLDSLFTGNSTNQARFRVTRDAGGSWQFFADPAGGHAPVFTGETEDFTIPSGDFFGLLFTYTSSNATKFYFDDLYAGPLIVDTLPPTLLNAELINPSEIRLIYNETLDPATAEDEQKFILEPPGTHPYASILLLDASSVHLFFDLPLEKGKVYNLTICGVKDLSGNETDTLFTEIFFYPASPYDLVISEIMADPSPPFGLPEYEYLEIHNRSGFALNIEGLRLKIGASEHSLPDVEIEAGGFLLLCDDDAVGIMQHIARVAGLGSFSLPNTGTSLHLADSSGQTLFYAEYDPSMYGSGNKAEGGWSLEMTDLSHPCLGAENWAPSVNSSGGTPGEANSHNSSLPAGLNILRICTPTDSTLEIEFAQALDSLAASATERYFVDPFPGHPASAIPLPPSFRSVLLSFDEAMVAGQEYSLMVMPGLVNCTGTASDESLMQSFAIAEPVQPFDIVINEILFNPEGDGVDYVEIYNRSVKTIDLREIYLASVKESTAGIPDTQSVMLTADCSILMPGRFLVLSSSQETVKLQFYTPDPRAFLDMDPFPSYNNDKGSVLLMSSANLLIDGMNYDEEMHFLLLNTTDGVALERINPDASGYDRRNWHSAAETAGFGTPGYRNSQYLEFDAGNSAVSLQPEIFSPDGDGIDDQLGIAYSFDTPGKLLSVLIFNMEGRLARTLVNNEMPGTQGVYTWDGTMDDRTPAQTGIYIVYLEALGMDGKTSRYKNAAVLTRNR